MIYLLKVSYRVYFNFPLIHNVPVGETPTGSGLYRRV